MAFCRLTNYSKDINQITSYLLNWGLMKGDNYVLFILSRLFDNVINGLAGPIPFFILLKEFFESNFLDIICGNS